MSELLLSLAVEGQGTFTLDDQHVFRHDGEKLGDQGGDLTPFLVDLDGERYVMVVGECPDVETRYVSVNEYVTVPVNPEAVGRSWMTPPMPFVLGMTVVAVGTATPNGEELWRLESPPLTGDRPQPVLGSGWTRYA